jgi:hypothetical protein
MQIADNLWSRLFSDEYTAGLCWRSQGKEPVYVYTPRAKAGEPQPETQYYDKIKKNDPPIRNLVLREYRNKLNYFYIV